MINYRLFTFIIAIFLGVFHVSAQTYNLSGIIVDRDENTPLEAVNVVVANVLDTTKITWISTDSTGSFILKDLPSGIYNFKASYLGYISYSIRNISIKANKNLGLIKMEHTLAQLKAAEVVAFAKRTEMIGDTVQYDAKAFKVNPDATAEGLVEKMPGIIINPDGSVQAHGETVKKVLIDGQEFFSDDPTIALRNLPAEVISKIQVFDQLSDQAQFTGFDDGNSQKTINIITKTGKSNGQFGKVFGGYGTDDRYWTGGNINFFNGPERISIIGLSNNINQQNFSTQDLLGVLGTNSQQRGGGSGRSGNSGGGTGGYSGGPGGGAGNGPNPNNFLVGQQGGINTTNSIGLNFIDKIGTKLTINASYFYNNTNNLTTSNIIRQNFLTDTTTQYYSEKDTGSSHNYNHRASARIVYDIDSFNSIIFTPKLVYQDNNSSSPINGINTFQNDTLSTTMASYFAHTGGYDFSDNLLLRHKFKKKGRTISLNIATDINNKTGSTGIVSRTEYFQSNDSIVTANQQAQTGTKGYTIAPNIAYTEPLSSVSILQFNYNPSYMQNHTYKTTNSLDSASDVYSSLDSLLSNRFQNTVISQKEGLSYRLKGDKFNLMLGVANQNTQLSDKETFPTIFNINKSYENVLPSAIFNYNFNKSDKLRILYFTSTVAPSITQLQNVINNANPLQLITGNPDLKQAYNQGLTVRYTLLNTTAGQTFIGYANASFQNDYIANSTIIASKDTTINNGVNSVLLNKGSQITSPVNLPGYANAKAFLTYGFPIKFLKSNLNLNAGYIFTETPGLINGITNVASTNNYTGGLVLGSNISEKVDFTLSYSGNYNMIANTIQPNLNNNYFYHNADFKINLLSWSGLVLNTELNNTLYTGLGSNDENIFLWNAGIGYKFMKNKVAELRLSCFDILNQNQNITRTVTDTYVEDTKTQVLKRYLMMTFTYNIKNFRVQKNKPAADIK